MMFQIADRTRPTRWHVPHRLVSSLLLLATVSATLQAAPASRAPLGRGELILAVEHQGQCLSTSGPQGKDARLQLSPCAPDVAEQYWRVEDKTLRSADGNWCVTARQLENLAPLTLQACNSSGQQNWHLSDQQFRNGLFALDQDTDSSVVVYERHGNPNQRWKRLEDLRREVGTAPPAHYPISIHDRTTLAQETARDLINRLTPLSEPLPYPRNTAVFPGSMPSPLPPVSRSYSMDRRVGKYSHTGWQPDWVQTLHTGLWVPAGTIITIRLNGAPGTAAKGLRARIGPHTDQLNADGKPINDEDTMRRYAKVSTDLMLKPGLNAMRSQYGGLLQVDSLGYADATVSFQVDNAIEAAYFNISQHSLADWPRIRAMAGPWVTLEGKRTVLTVPREQVQHLQDPVALLKQYDHDIEASEWLAGFDGLGAAHPRQTLKQYLLWDPQSGAGYGHSGYPIVVTGDWKLMDTAADYWGYRHEIGHNYQQDLWCDTFGSESTVNLFPLYLERQLGPTTRLSSEGISAATVAKLRAGKIRSFKNDSDEKDKMVFQMQLVDAFPERSWALYRDLFRAYRELSSTEQQALQGSETAQYDKHYELLSRLSGYDLREHYAHWGVPLSARVLSLVGNLHLPRPKVKTWLIKPS